MSLHYTKENSYLIFIELLLFVSTSGHFECDPRKNCEVANYQGYNQVPNPYDCFSYYYCIVDAFGNPVPSDNPVPCLPGKYFDALSKTCYTGSECKYPCSVLCNPYCTYYANERIADVDDCSTYYTCLPSGEKEKNRCPENVPYFDGVSCSTRNYSCCTEEAKCSPFCDDFKREVVDPYDCHSFYLCLDGLGPPTENDRYSCEEGQYFDTTLGKCGVEYSPCVSLCSK